MKNIFLVVAVSLMPSLVFASSNDVSIEKLKIPVGEGLTADCINRYEHTGVLIETDTARLEFRHGSKNIKFGFQLASFCPPLGTPQ